MNRLPLRLRLTAIFALVMALVLTVTGYITLSRFGESEREYGTPARLAAQHEALDDLRRELLTFLPIVFVIATVGAYLLTGAALRPVERMRAQAAAVTEDTPGRRLDVPPGRDEIARLAATLNDMLARLHAALERERRFVADAGHELRTPLSMLQAEIELALRRPRQAAELRAALVSALEETVRLVQLTEELLLLARTDRTRTDFRAERVWVVPLLHRIGDRLAKTAPDRRITVDCPSDLAVSVAEERLACAVTNLADNALRHGHGHIQISADAHGGQAAIHVRDDGPGFPPGFLPHAFDRFTQADRARSTAGTGLGLAITAAIARAAGGTYGAANRHDGGADVWITLPTATTPVRRHNTR
jgi:signal transduction histidine kinase